MSDDNTITKDASIGPIWDVRTQRYRVERDLPEKHQALASVGGTFQAWS